MEVSTVLTIDCQTCPVRGRHCGDCFVPVLAQDWLVDDLAADLADDLAAAGSSASGPGPLALDDAEAAAVAAFVRAGLLAAGDAAALHALRVAGRWAAVG